MSDYDAQALCDLAKTLARDAGRMLLDRRPGDLRAGTKSSPTDLVTVMDRAAERLILDGLAAARPGDGVLAEEGGTRESSTGVRWVVDPLDGTVNYVYDLPAWGVSIAAEVDGSVVAGVVYDPTHDIVYDAVRGRGARANGTPLACNPVDDLAVTMLGTGFSYSAERRAGQARIVAAVLPQVRDIRRMGAAALDLCSVATGRLDAFYELDLKPWDCAAGELIAAEAGASIGSVDTSDGPVLVAACPGVYDALHAMLQGLYAAG